MLWTGCHAVWNPLSWPDAISTCTPAFLQRAAVLTPGKTCIHIFVEKLEVAEGDEIVFDQVKALSDNNGFKAGTPVVAGAKVTAKVLKNGKGKKIYVLKYKSKKNEKKKIGHRQPYTKVQIVKIEG